jgi:hypothetical protein
MERKYRSIAWVLLAAALVASCAYNGAKFDFSRIPLLRQGVTTQDEAFRMFGRPLETSRVKDGSSVYLVWFYRYVPTKGDGAVLKLLFDGNGVLHSSEYKLVHEQ